MTQVNRKNVVVLFMAIAVVAWLLFVLPGEFVVLSPGPLFDAGQVVSVKAHPSPGPGKILVATVQVQFPSWVTLLRAAFDPRDQVTWKTSVIPAGMSVAEFEEKARRQMVQAQNDAVAAARAYLHERGIVDDSAVVGQDISFGLQDVGGPSAGLALALQIVSDYMGRDLTGGRVVVVTGAIGAAGNVMAVGGVAIKARAAAEASAALMLVPAAEVNEVGSQAGKVRVVGVSSLDQAVAALRAAGGSVCPEGWLGRGVCLVDTGHVW